MNGKPREYHQFDAVSALNRIIQPLVNKKYKHIHELPPNFHHGKKSSRTFFIKMLICKIEWEIRPVEAAFSKNQIFHEVQRRNKSLK